MKLLVKPYILFLVVVVSSQSLIAQDSTRIKQAEPEVISYEQILDQLINGNRSTVSYSNKVIDLGITSLRKIDRLFPKAKIDSGKLILNKSLELHKCVINGKGFADLRINSILLNGCTTNTLTISNVQVNNLEITRSELNRLRILNSTFENARISSLISSNKSAGTITIFKTLVTDQLLLNDNSNFNNIGIVGSELNTLSLRNNSTKITGLTNNTIISNLNVMDELATEVMLRKNSFLGDSIPATLSVDCDRLILLENTFHVPVQFAESRVNTRVEISKNHFIQAADFHDVSFPEFGKYVPFSQFEKGFVVYKNLYGEDSPDGTNCYYCELYRGETKEELADKTNFDKLVQSYEILFHGYKATGDIESANLSYIRIKDLYLNRLGYLYRTNGGFKHYFRWKLAQLLKFYTNHGTDPALSIVISIYVILIFAVFYVFFPSEWDVTSKARLISDFKDFVEKNEKGRVRPFLTLLIGFGISIINAITLSLNSFVTLGFGTIPTTGAARYVCILQGFIGWFLLSIFTVSLINQILF